MCMRMYMYVLNIELSFSEVLVQLFVDMTYRVS